MKDRTIFNIQKRICIATVILFFTVACIFLVVEQENVAMYKTVAGLFVSIACAIIWVCIIADDKYEAQAYENLKRDMNIGVALHVLSLGGGSIILLLKILGVY